HQCASPSTTGPSVSAGKIISPAVSAITPTSKTANVGPSVRNVPAETGATFFWTSEPPSASAAMSGTKRPRYSATVPNEAEKLVAVYRATARPLLSDCEWYAYGAGVTPCARGLKTDARRAGAETATAVIPSTIVGTKSAPTAATLISRASIFLPSHSGVR